MCSPVCELRALSLLRPHRTGGQWRRSPGRNPPAQLPCTCCPSCYFVLAEMGKFKGFPHQAMRIMEKVEIDYTGFTSEGELYGEEYFLMATT